jgi:hypothetical protein
MSVLILLKLMGITGQENKDYGCRDLPLWLRDTPLSAKVGTNFAGKLQLLGWYSSKVTEVLVKGTHESCSNETCMWHCTGGYLAVYTSAIEYLWNNSHIWANGNSVTLLDTGVSDA